MEYTCYRCDICGVTKGEANHWYRAARVPGPRFVLIPWELTMRDPMAKEMHLCGLGCASKAMLQAMTEEVVREEVPPSPGVQPSQPWPRGQADVTPGVLAVIAKLRRPLPIHDLELSRRNRLFPALVAALEALVRERHLPESSSVEATHKADATDAALAALVKATEGIAS